MTYYVMKSYLSFSLSVEPLCQVELSVPLPSEPQRCQLRMSRGKNAGEQDLRRQQHLRYLCQNTLGRVPLHLEQNGRAALGRFVSNSHVTPH